MTSAGWFGRLDRITLQRIASVPCPQCRADIGQPCQPDPTPGALPFPHPERIEAAERGPRRLNGRRRD